MCAIIAVLQQKTTLSKIGNGKLAIHAQNRYLNRHKRRILDKIKEIADMDAPEIKKLIRDIPDWPKQGVIFRDIAPLLASPEGFSSTIKLMTDPFIDAGIEYVAATEARGFIFGAAVAEKLKAGFVPVRKKGKLPWKTQQVTYELEYGTDTLEVHIDAFKENSKVLLVDDVLATGGTMKATAELIEQINGHVEGISFLLELKFLAGRDKLANHKIATVLEY